MVTDERRVAVHQSSRRSSAFSRGRGRLTARVRIARDRRAEKHARPGHASRRKLLRWVEVEYLLRSKYGVNTRNEKTRLSIEKLMRWSSILK